MKRKMVITKQQLIDGLEWDLKIYHKTINDFYGEEGTDIRDFIEAHYIANYIEFLLDDVLTGEFSQAPSAR